MEIGTPFQYTNCPSSYRNSKLERLCSEDTPATSWLPILLRHIGSQVKRRKSQSYKFKEFAKIAIFPFLKQTLHATHIRKFLDKMWKYEMDPTSIVEDTERTRFCPQTNRRTRWNQYLRWRFFVLRLPKEQLEYYQISWYVHLFLAYNMPEAAWF